MNCSQNQSDQKHNRTTADRHREKILCDPRHNQPDNQCRRACGNVIGGRENGRKGHHRQSHIRDVIKEGPEPPAADRFPDEQKRQKPDGINGQCHDQQRKIYVF